MSSRSLISNVLRIARSRNNAVVSGVRFTSTVHENDAKTLEEEKARNLQGIQHKTSTPHKHAPGWNEYLATSSEASLKADQGAGTMAELQQTTIEHVTTRHQVKGESKTHPEVLAERTVEERKSETWSDDKKTGSEENVKADREVYTSGQ